MKLPLREINERDIANLPPEMKWKSGKEKNKDTGQPSGVQKKQSVSCTLFNIVLTYEQRL